MQQNKTKKGKKAGMEGNGVGHKIRKKKQQ